MYIINFQFIVISLTWRYVLKNPMNFLYQNNWYWLYITHTVICACVVRSCSDIAFADESYIKDTLNQFANQDRQCLHMNHTLIFMYWLKSFVINDWLIQNSSASFSDIIPKFNYFIPPFLSFKIQQYSLPLSKWEGSQSSFRFTMDYHCSSDILRFLKCIYEGSHVVEWYLHFSSLSSHWSGSSRPL